MQCKYLNYYLSPSEKNEYYNKWLQLSCGHFNAFTCDQYFVYNELTIENSHIDYVQSNHYMDDGCICKACVLKRAEIAYKLIQGQSISASDRIQHDEAKNELLTKQVHRINRINTVIQQLPKPKLKGNRKDFKNAMKQIVNIGH